MALTGEEKGKGVDTCTKQRAWEGNITNSNNSFSVLDNCEIVDRSMHMGIIIEENNFSAIDMIKDLEAARFALNKKQLDTLKQGDQEDSETHKSDYENEGIITLEEWEDRSEEDDFTLVTPKRVRKPPKNSHTPLSNQKKGKARKILA